MTDFKSLARDMLSEIDDEVNEALSLVSDAIDELEAENYTDALDKLSDAYTQLDKLRDNLY